MAFCTNCGQQVNESQIFCGSCGAKLKSAAAPEPTAPHLASPQLSAPSGHNFPPAFGGETIRAIVTNMQVSKSWGRSDAYNLLVTEHRTIFAKLTQEIINATVVARRTQATAEGKGFFGKWAAQMKGFNTYGDHYQGFTPDQALNETPGNWAIENNTIQQIKVDSNDDDEGGQTWYAITIKTIDQKYYFKSNWADPTNMFKQAYPGIPIK
jgi:hypothetical protein